MHFFRDSQIVVENFNKTTSTENNAAQDDDQA